MADFELLADTLGLTASQIEAAADNLNLFDFTDLVHAVNQGDKETALDIVKKNKSLFVNKTLPSDSEIAVFYRELLDTESPNEALASTADHFGIKGEDVTRAVRKVEAPSNDTVVKDVAESIQNQTGRLLTELNQWQRRELLKIVDPIVATEIVRVSELSPTQVMKEHAMINGFSVPTYIENELTLTEMSDHILKTNITRILNSQSE